MEFTFALSVGVLTTAGIYLMLRAQTFPVILGLTLLSYAVNLFLFASGRLTVNGAAIVGHSEQLADPLPQALVLTAIVIGFAMTAFILILAIRARADLGNDHVDGRELPPERSAIEEALADRIEKNTAAHKAQHNKSHSRHKRKQS
ncbi:MAG: Na+/H+ antiporter subunit C [Pseudomonadales bacterium]|jgi:multicomponent K+:H+ antiporter subunit C|nr:Na+/H+ antiporter subunit C [Pseudomonadales bacterium]RLT87228.1 MAG: Na+/H+ antiporter subunit C [Ketobacter sp. GenoA1]RLT92325.1 MAG: Na+/H+ antiporter subunit C [Ketobacter sp.]TNC86160.1 MAG: Na+/H+ antiporter subunit C [Alcanivorax sp.]HAG96259.1 Na+/H+ antiporter subunit C [Gammaproteobacteria bacterium]|tara:strand:+ start:10102 stop:10539 length:438 start_codon:yes stop_codon:yes gene_type:complete